MKNSMKVSQRTTPVSKVRAQYLDCKLPVQPFRTPIIDLRKGKI